MASYQRRLASFHNRRVKSRMFKAGDLVIRRVFENTANPADGKFQPNWEGPYTMVRVGIVGSYVLRRPDGTVVSRIWNVMHPKKYYQ